MVNKILKVAAKELSNILDLYIKKIDNTKNFQLENAIKYLEENINKNDEKIIKECDVLILLINEIKNAA